MSEALEIKSAREDTTLSSAEVKDYLSHNEIKPLRNWVPRTPILYAFEQRFLNDDGPFNDVPRSERPSIVRIDEPVSIDFDDPKSTPEGVVYEMKSGGSRVDYYVVDRSTQKPRLIRSTLGKSGVYYILKDELYEAHDSIFPRSQTP